jgi:RHS repeat-associated protein
MSVARNAFQTVISRWDLNTGNDPVFLIPYHDRTNNQTALAIWFNNKLTNQTIDGLPVSAVDLWFAGSLEMDPDEDFIPNDGSCAADDANPDNNSDDPQRRDGEDDPPITWIPSPTEDIAIIGDDGTAVKLGNDPIEGEPDNGATVTGFDDVIFAGIRDQQGQLSKATVLADPYARRVRPGPSMQEARTWHTASLQSDGRVLFSGGHDDNRRAIKSAELFDPKTNSFNRVADMTHARIGAKSAPLPACQGTLVTGGNQDTPQGDPQPQAEIFMLVNGGWQPTGNMIRPRAYHEMVVSPDGAIWIFGGEDAHGVVDVVERYDPNRGVFEQVGTMVEPRSHFDAVSFYDGRVALVGGRRPLPGSPSPSVADPMQRTWETVASIEVWDMNNPQIGGQVIAELPQGLSQPMAYRRGDDVMWVAGGDTEDGPSETVTAVDIDSGRTGTVSTTGPRGSHWHTTTRKKKKDEEVPDPPVVEEPPREREPVRHPGTRTRGTPLTPQDPDNGEEPDDNSSGPQDAGDPVDLYAGSFFLREVDYMLSGRSGMDLTFERTYDNQIEYLGAMGHGWDHNLNERLFRRGDGDIELHTGSAKIVMYKQNPDGTYASPPATYDQLRILPDGTTVIRDAHGMKKHFGTDGRLLKKSDRFGNQLTLEYNNEGRLVTVYDPYLRPLHFFYDDQGLLIRLEDFGGRQVVYEYNESQELVSATTHAVTNTPNGNDFPFGKTTRYTYACSTQKRELCHNLLTVTRPMEVLDGGVPYLINFYGEEEGRYDYDKVIRQIYGGTNHTGLAAGGEILYVYQELNPAASLDDLNIARNRTTVTDRNGHVSIYEHNNRGAEVKIINRAGNHRPIDDTPNPAPGTDPSELVVYKEYTSTGLLSRVTHGMGNSIIYVYDENNPDPLQRGNLLERTLRADALRGGKDEKVSYTYEPIYNQVLSIVSARGNDPSDQPRVGAWSRQRFMTTYIFDYQEGASLTALATESGRSEAGIQDSLQRAGVLLNLGDLNQDGRTDQIAGSIIQHKKPSVILSSWSTQRTVEGAGEQPVMITYVHNEFGQLLSETDPGGNVTLQEYYPAGDPDGDGREVRPGMAMTGGYLKAMIKDAKNTPGRQSTAPPRAVRKEFRYDRFGYLVATTDGRGNVTQQIHNQRGQVVRTIMAAPFFYEIDYYFDANDNLIRTDVQNQKPDDAGVDHILTENPYFTTRYDYDILDQLVMIEEETTGPYIPGEALPTESFRRIEHRYDGNGNQVETILPDNSRTVSEYDAFDRIFRITEAAGTPDAGTSTFHYDRNGNKILLIDAFDHGLPGPFNGDPTFLYYDGNDRLIATVDALGNISQKEYDAESQVVVLRLYDGQDGRNPNHLFRGHQGRLMAQTRSYYDEAGRLFETEDLWFIPGASSTMQIVTHRMEYNRLGLPVREIDRDGEARVRTFDGLNSLLTETDEVGNRMEYRYDDSHNIIQTSKVDMPDPGFGPPIVRSSYAVYDSLNRRIRGTNAIGDTYYFRHDSRGNLVWQTDSLGPRQPDPLGIVPMPITTVGNAHVFYFDALSRQVRRELQMRQNGRGDGAAVQPAGNPDGRITEVRRYDDRDNLIELTDDPDAGGLGSTTIFQYDLRARPTLEIRPDGTRVQTDYDPDGFRKGVIDGNGSRLRYSYDDLGRTVSTQIQRGPGIVGTTQQWSSYDGRGQSVSSFDNNDPADPLDDHTVTAVYDSLAHRIEERQNTFVLNAEYDTEDELTTMVHSDGVRISYERDRIDRLRKIKRQIPGGPLETLAEYDYAESDKAGRVRFANNTQSLHTYDAAGRLERMAYRSAAVPSAPVYEATYLYDEKNQRKATIYGHLGNAGDVYDYDSASRLVKVAYGVPDPRLEIAMSGTGGSPQKITSFDLDGMGNHLQVRHQTGTTTTLETYVPNLLNEYREANGQPLQYDPDGLPYSDGTNRFQFDVFGRLVEIREMSSNRLLAHYSYDALGRRLQVNYGKPDGTQEAVHLVYWGTEVIEEWSRTATPELLARFSTAFFHQARDDTDMDGDGNTTEFIDHFIARDILNSAVVTTGLAGEVLERYLYQVYGEPTVQNADGTQILTSSRLRNRSLFVGMRYEYESGLYHAVTRDFHPKMRRFLQRDVIGLMGGTNLYEYAGSNPLNFVDPLGTSEQVVYGAQGAFDFIAGRNHPQFSPLAQALGETLRQKGRQLWRQYGSSPEVYQHKINQLEDLFMQLAQSLARRYNAWVQEKNARAQENSGWSFDWDKFKQWWTPLATGASFLPFVGDVFDAIGLVVGFDMTTLEWLSPAERAIMGAGLLIGSGAAMLQAAKAAKTALRGADEVRDGAKALGNTPTCGRTCTPNSGNCFVAGTLIVSVSGSVPIESLSTGDKVTSWNESAQQSAITEVKEAYDRKVAQIIQLEIRRGSEREILGVTPEHPFWVMDEGWLEAAKLRAGDKLRGADGMPIEVIATQIILGQTTTYNINVNGTHNYYAGRLGVLTHNTDCDFDDLIDLSDVDDFDDPVPLGERLKEGYIDDLDLDAHDAEFYSSFGSRAKEGTHGTPGHAGKRFGPDVQDQARQESGNSCVFCGKPTDTDSRIDHAHPMSRGGDNTLDNAQNTCERCNLKKSDKTSQEFIDGVLSGQIQLLILFGMGLEDSAHP